MSVYTWSIERTEWWLFRYYATIEDRTFPLGLRNTALCLTLWGARRWVRKQEHKIRLSKAEPVESGTFEVEKKSR